MKNKFKKDFFIAVHPGEVLQDIIDGSDLTQLGLAKHIGVKHSVINEICRCKRGISAEMAVKLSQALNQSPDFWMGLQAEWELSQVLKHESIEPMKLRA